MAAKNTQNLLETMANAKTFYHPGETDGPKPMEIFGAFKNQRTNQYQPRPATCIFCDKAGHAVEKCFKQTIRKQLNSITIAENIKPIIDDCSELNMFLSSTQQNEISLLVFNCL